MSWTSAAELAVALEIFGEATDRDEPIDWRY